MVGYLLFLLALLLLVYFIFKRPNLIGKWPEEFGVGVQKDRLEDMRCSICIQKNCFKVRQFKLNQNLMKNIFTN